MVKFVRADETFQSRCCLFKKLTPLEIALEVFSATGIILWEDCIQNEPYLLFKGGEAQNEDLRKSLALDFPFGYGYQINKGVGLLDCHIGEHLAIEGNTGLF